MELQKGLIQQLAGFLGPDRLLTDPAELEDHSWDALSESRIHPQRKIASIPPLCIVLPANTEEVRKVVLLANREGVSIVPYGGGSGLMGGAISLRRGLVLDLRKMGEALEVDRESRSVKVQAGMVLEALEKRLNGDGFILGHDPWTLPVATVGGAISTNSLGYRGGLYGSMGDQVLGLEAVLPQGEVVCTRAVEKSSTGIDLKRLFIGGEGCFGIVTEATLRIFPLPEKRSLLAFRFASFETGFKAILAVFGRGIKPALMDFGDEGAQGSRAILYFGLEGMGAVVETEEGVMRTICEDEGGEGLSPSVAERFWNDRHVVARNFAQNRRRRRGPARPGWRRDWIHVALAPSRVLRFRQQAKDLLGVGGLHLEESGLWTHPGLFSLRFSLEEGRAPTETLEEMVETLLRLVQKMGGAMEYCHGVGVKLAPLMAEELGVGLEIMRRIKGVLDPNNIMNPGKLGL